MSVNKTSSVQVRTRDTLQQQVQGGRWAVGQRLPSERQLALELVVSRSTVREAISHLMAQGLLITRAGSGVYVANPGSTPGLAPASSESALLKRLDHPLLRVDMLEFRLMFECGTAQLAATRATTGQRHALGQVVERMQAAVAAEDIDAEASADAEFHELLAASAHNLMIRHFHAQVINSLRLHITHNTYDASRSRGVLARQQCLLRLQQHQAIYQAVMQRSPQAASEAMREHILFVGRQFVNELAAAHGSGLDAYRPALSSR